MIVAKKDTKTSRLIVEQLRAALQLFLTLAATNIASVSFRYSAELTRLATLHAWTRSATHCSEKARHSK